MATENDAIQKAIKDSIGAGQAATMYDDSAFILPSVADFYLDDVPTNFLSYAAKELIGEGSDATQAAFFIEEPPTTEHVYNTEQNYFTFGMSDLKDSCVCDDGDTVYFRCSNIMGETKRMDIVGKSYDGLVDLIRSTHGGTDTALAEVNRLGEELPSDACVIRFLGIDCPEIIHHEKVLKKDSFEYDEYKWKDVHIGAAQYSTRPEFQIDSGYLSKIENLNSDTVLKFCKEKAGMRSDKWYQIVDDAKLLYCYKDDTISQTPEENESAKLQADMVQYAFDNAEDVLVVIDAQSINRETIEYEDRNQILAAINSAYQAIYARPANMPGQDIYKRWLGVIYVKMKIGGVSTWINLSKYVLAKSEMSGANVNPVFGSNTTVNEHNSFVSSVFDNDSYQNYKRTKYVDALNEMSDMDDRNKVQQELTGMDMNAFREYTIMIGDCLFVVPPTSIRSLAQTTAERQPLLRARGSLTKAGHKMEKTIEMTLYSNENDINGYEYQTTLPSGKSVTYRMNGLRSLISQFKFTPFLPIENDHINTVLGVDAVSLKNIQISTMPGFPRCLVAQLTLEEFNYHIYMPELPTDSAGDNENMFAKTISFDLMRHYYQKAIAKGEAIKDMDPNSEEYIQNTLGSATALQPMKFNSPYIDFYLADEEYLQQLLQVKVAAINAPLKIVTSLTEDEKNYELKLGDSFAKFKEAIDYADAQDYGDAIGGGVGNLVSINKDYFDKIVTYLDSNVSSASSMVTSITANSSNSYEFPKGVNSKDVEVLVALDLTGLPNGVTSLENIITSATVGNEITIADTMTNDGLIKLVFTADVDTNKIQCNRSCGGYIFFKECATLFTGNDSDTAAEGEALESASTEYFKREADKLGMTVEEYQMWLKGQVDVQSATSMKFTKQVIDSLTVVSMSAVFGNNFTKMGLEAFDGFAPQFSGGQDTVLEVKIQTMNAQSASMLTMLPKMATRYARDYKLVLNCWPMRIDSELSRFLGVNEVVIDSVSTDTVPNFPGLYEITMRLVSVDRTLRNREAMMKVTESVAGSASISNAGQTSMKSYFKLKDTLQQVELYPDLELPTIEELGQVGYKFLRYKMNTGRKYVDPDFYFVYGHILGHQVFRESILSSFKNTIFEDKDGTVTTYNVADTIGTSATQRILTGTDATDSDSNQVLELSDQNDEYKSLEESIKNIKDTMQKARAESAEGALASEQKLSENEKILLKDFEMMDLGEGWHIADKVRARFGEKQYAKFMYKKDDGSAVDDVSNQLYKKRQSAINSINEILKKPIESVAKFDMTKETTTFLYNGGIQMPLEKVTNFHADESIQSALSDAVLKINDTWIYEALGCGTQDVASIRDEVDEAIRAMLYAAGCAITGQTECDIKNKSTGDYSWRPSMFRAKSYVNTSQISSADNKVVPTCRIIPAQKCGTDNNDRYADTLEEALSDGAYKFGAFGIELYDVGILISKGLISKDEAAEAEARVFLDPRYRTSGKYKATQAEIAQYKKAILFDADAAAEAFVRCMLVMMKKMLEDGMLISMYDMMWKQVKENLKQMIYENKLYYGSDQSSSSKVSTNEPANKIDEATLSFYEDAYNAIEKNNAPLLAGKFLPAVALLSAANDDTLYGAMKNRNYGSLNGMTSSSLTNVSAIESLSKSSKAYRKFIKGLYGAGLVDALENLESDSDTKTLGDLLNESFGAMMVVSRAEDPSYWVRDSYLDMIQNDKRGRMLRAFPTFYMMFIDEGRKIGYWKLHDNFYNMSAISEITVTKSRRMAADTASITMSNMFNTYTEYDEDVKEIVSYDIADVFDSIFSPRKYFLKEEQRRQEAQKVQKTKLAPGVRMSIRMGYGADASALPIVFNGCMAEVNVGSSVEITAQGDGVELINPIMSDTDAEMLQHHEDFSLLQAMENAMTNSSSPRSILTNLLTNRGGWFRKQVRQFTNGRFFNDNIYGITHFGEMEYKDIFDSGEVAQNIFEAMPYPSWANKKDDNGGSQHTGLYEDSALDECPKISFHVLGKSFWDIMHICQSVQPDFITSIVPFGLRSSVFYGAPRYYYAHDYEQTEDGFGEYKVKERRKPFQQFHVYTSFSDIIHNSIATDAKQVKTCAVGMYSDTGWLGREHARVLDPIWVDISIYNEQQKTMQYDTQYLGKTNVAGAIFPFLAYFEDKLADDKGSVQSPTVLAWRMTANALKESVKDMYAGEFTVIGDPSVKPYDRVSIMDSYNNMQGTMLAETVIQSMSVETGYTTSVYPDCIACVDDRHEQVAQSLNGVALGRAMMIYAPMCMLSHKFGSEGKPLMMALLKGIAKGGAATEGSINTVLKAIGKDELSKHGSFLDKVDGAYGKIGIDTTDVRVSTYFESLEGLMGKFEITPDDTIKSLAKRLKNLKGTAAKYDATDIASKIESGALTKKADPAAKAKVAQGLKNTNVSETIDTQLRAQYQTAASETYEAVAELDKMTPEELKEFESIADKISKKQPLDFDELAKVGKLADTYGAALDEDVIKSIMKTTSIADAKVVANLEKTLNPLIKDGKALKGIFSVVTKTGAMFTIMATAVEFAITYLVSACVQESLERYMRSLQAVQVYPITKNGKPLMAGMNGQTGAVVGAPVTNKAPSVKTLFADIFADHIDTPQGKAYDMLRSVFLDDTEIDKIIGTWSVNNNVTSSGSVNLDSETGRTEFIKQLTSAKAADEVKSLSSFHASLMQQRIQKFTDEEAKYAYKKYAIPYSAPISSISAIKEDLVPVLGATKVKKHLENGYLVSAHKKNGSMVSFATAKDNVQHPCISRGTDASPKLDIPYLRPDALTMFTEIMSKLEAYYAPESGKTGSENGLKQHFVTLESCTIVGDKSSWASTGYMFKMQVNDCPDLVKILDGTKSDLLTMEESGGNIIGSTSLNGIFFTMKPKDSGFVCIVHPVKTI
jgi:hypothetical protein